MKNNLHKTLVMALALIVLAGILAACGGGTSGASTGAASTAGSAAPAADSGTVTVNSDGERVLVYAVPEAPTYLDPHNQATIAIYRATTQIFDRLVLLNNDMEIVPRLAESWEVEDDRTTVFHLRDDIYFHNGDHMTAEDVKWSLERTMASPGVNYNYLIIPSILLSIAIVAALGPSLVNMLIAITVSNIPPFARVVRASVLTIRNEEYVEAARAIGARDKRILLRHIIPNALAPVIVQVTLSIAGSILAIASLSFIGLGIQPPTPEWGSMLSGGRQYIRSAWWVCTFPGVAIMLSILSLNMLGDGLRDALDPKLKN